jgi:hypothetical protein
MTGEKGTFPYRFWGEESAEHKNFLIGVEPLAQLEPSNLF